MIDDNSLLSLDQKNLASNSSFSSSSNNKDKDNYPIDTSWPFWRYASSLPIYVLPLAAATGGYLFTESQLTNQSISLKTLAASGSALLIFLVFYMALKELRRTARHKPSPKNRYRNLFLVGLILSLGISACGLEYGWLSNNPSPLIKFGIPALTFFVGAMILMVCHFYHYKIKGADDKDPKIKRRSRDFCFFIIFVLIMGFCSALGAYAFWNMLLGQIAGIIMGAIFLIANGFLLGRDYLSLISAKEESQDQEKTEDDTGASDLIGKIFNFIGTVGVLLGFNYEVFSLFGITAKGPGFQHLHSVAKAAFILASIASISFSLWYCVLAIRRLQKFKSYKKDDTALLQELKDNNSINYKGSKHKKSSWIFAGITFIAIIFNCLAFASGSFGEIMHQQGPLIAVICIYTLFSSFPGSILLSRGFRNDAEGEYYKNRADALLKEYVKEEDDNISLSISDHSIDKAAPISKKVLTSAKILKDYYNKKLNIYWPSLEKRAELSIYRTINPPGKLENFKLLDRLKLGCLNSQTTVNFLEWLGLGLQFAGLVYLVWSPVNGLFKGQSLGLKIGATCFIFFLFVIASALKFHNIYLNNKKEIKELTETSDKLNNLICKHSSIEEKQQDETDEDGSPSTKTVI